MLRRMVVRLRKQSGMRVQSRRESTTIRFLGMENSGIGVDNRHQEWLFHANRGGAVLVIGLDTSERLVADAGVQANSRGIVLAHFQPYPVPAGLHGDGFGACEECAGHSRPTVLRHNGYGIDARDK